MLSERRPRQDEGAITFYTHGDLVKTIIVEIDHAAGMVDIRIQRPVESSRMVQIPVESAVWFGH